MNIIILLAKGILFLIFCLLSGFVLAFGKSDSNIKPYYAFTALCLVGGILVT